MGINPVDAVYVNGVAVSKAAVRAYSRRLIYDFTAVADVQGGDIDGVNTLSINSVLYSYDSLDLVTADDGVNVIVDLAGRRFKKVTTPLNGNAFFRQTALAGTANALQVTLDGVLAAYSSTPQYALITPSVANGGPVTVKFGAFGIISLLAPDGSALADSQLIAGRALFVEITTTQAKILMTGATW